MTERVKYPKTLHLPWSEAITDDPWLSSVEHFVGKQIVVSEKLDGEGETLSRDFIHARSVEGHPHPSRTWVRNLWGKIRHEIPDNFRICGENLYAEHSIHYSALDSYFMVFNIWDGDWCLPWDETLEYCKMLGLASVPVLADGLWEESGIKACMTGVSRQGGSQEGYVVRLADGFLRKDFPKSIAKFVRKGHVQTNSHWMDKPVVPNDLRVKP